MCSERKKLANQRIIGTFWISTIVIGRNRGHLTFSLHLKTLSVPFSAFACRDMRGGGASHQEVSEGLASF
jgi:hypothetical protein